MTGDVVGDLVPLVSAAVVVFGTYGKGIRYVKAIVRALVETV